MHKHSTIFVAGQKSLLGSAINKELRRQDFLNLVAMDEPEPDLANKDEVEEFFSRHVPEYVFLAAGPSGGIRKNQKMPADLIRENLLVECNVIDAAYRHKTRKLLFLASSCCYPKQCSQPMRSDFLLSGPVEETSQSYAVAKLAGIQLCKAYRQQYGVSFGSAIPADVFGPGDEWSPEDAHVVPALIQRMHEAKTTRAATVTVWGSGEPRRELMFSEDLADACVFAMQNYDGAECINLGVGSDLSIREIAALIKNVVGYDGELHFDKSQPDGMPAKLLDSSVLRDLGWRPRTGIQAALEKTYEGFLQVRSRAAEHL